MTDDGVGGMDRRPEPPLAWVVDLGDFGLSLAIDDSAVYVVTRSYMLAFDVSDGSSVWEVELLDGAEGDECLLLEGRSVLVIREGVVVYAFDQTTGVDVPDLVGGQRPCDIGRVDLGYSFTDTALVYEGRAVWVYPGSAPHWLTAVRRLGGHTLVNDFDAGLILIVDDTNPTTLLEAGRREVDESPIASHGGSFAAVIASGFLAFGVLPV